MANKKYTLYLKVDNSGKEVNIPLIHDYLKEIDNYTVNFKNNNELFGCLPNKITLYLNDKFNISLIQDNFFITDGDFTPIMKVLYEKDLDVLHIEPKEIKELFLNKLMTKEEFSRSLLKLNCNIKIRKKYEFFKYLYDNYVKGKKIKCMIDLYEIKKYNNLSLDDMYICAIATNNENLVVLAKKIFQTMEQRRDVVLLYKKMFGSLENMNQNKINIRKKTNFNIAELNQTIINNFQKNN